MLIYRDFTFDAAHVLDGYDETHPYGRVHGHSFRARVWIEGDPELESNMIADLGLIAKECEKVKNLLDHNTLNNVDGLHNPTLEGLCVFIWEKLITKFTNLNKIEVHRDQSGEGSILNRFILVSGLSVGLPAVRTSEFFLKLFFRHLNVKMLLMGYLKTLFGVRKFFPFAPASGDRPPP